MTSSLYLVLVNRTLCIVSLKIVKRVEDGEEDSRVALQLFDTYVGCAVVS